jgi:hypothetical protein
MWLTRMCRPSADAGLLHGGVEEVVGVFGDELVQGVEFATSTATDEPRRRPARPACCQAEDAARIAEEHGRVRLMSIPSSRAFVETTPSTDPSRRLARSRVA